MNDTFNIKRFGNWFISDMKACISRYGLNFLLLSLMGLVIYAVTAVTGLMINGTWGSPGLIFRTITFVICAMIMVLTLPSKCYGHLTDKRAGSAWLMIPASAFEKFLSMTLISAIVIPALFTGIYVCTDMLICSLDPSCGEPVHTVGRMMFADNPDMPEEVRTVLKPMMNPYLYIDDIIGTTLLFLLGAVCFKSAKTVKTLLFMMVSSAAIGIITTPFVHSYFMDIMNDPSISAEAMFGSGLFRNLNVIDTISDMTILVAAAVVLFFRIKTIKH